MQKSDYDRLMSYNVSTLFTLITHHNKFHHKTRSSLKNCYSLCLEDINPNTGEMVEDFIYFVYKYADDVDDYIDDEFMGDSTCSEKIYVGDYIVLKLDKWTYMAQNEWEKLKNSDYYSFRGTLYKGIMNFEPNSLIRCIIDKNAILQEELSDYIGSDIKETNMFWKAFDFELETLDLSKISDMTYLSYSKQWLLEEMRKANKADQIVYQKVLDNSIDYAPSVISLGADKRVSNDILDFSDIHKRLKEKLVELTGKPQYRLEIKGNKYNFLPGEKDFNIRLTKVCKKYGLVDIEKIEKCLTTHLIRLQSPLIEYYISKDSSSKLASDYETYDDEVRENIQKKSSNNELF